MLRDVITAQEPVTLESSVHVKMTPKWRYQAHVYLHDELRCLSLVLVLLNTNVNVFKLNICSLKQHTERRFY